MASADIEMDVLPNAGNRTPAGTSTDLHSTRPAKEPQVVDDGVVSTWAWASAALTSLVAVPLMLSPRLLLFLSETGTERRAALTPLEAFLAWNTGIMLSAVALALVFNVPAGLEDVNSKRNPADHPLLTPFSAACVLISFMAYNTTSVGPLAFLLCLGSGTIGLWGLWAILFAGSSSISRTTGADKRTSRFIFGNKAAAYWQKKRWKTERSREE